MDIGRVLVILEASSFAEMESKQVSVNSFGDKKRFLPPFCSLLILAWGFWESGPDCGVEPFFGKVGKILEVYSFIFAEIGV